MATSSRAVQVNTGVFLVTNGIRRSAASFTNNFITLDGGVDSSVRNIPAGGTWTYQPPTSDSSIIVVQTSGPIVADVTLTPVTANPPVVPAGRSAQAFQLLVNRTLTLDDKVTSVVFSNEGEDTVQINVLCG